MKILYLEDDANMREHTTNFLRQDGYDVEEFQRIDQVKEYYKDSYSNVSCIITDLNMSDEWLENYQGESDGCILSGWVWLQRFVYTITPDIPTIIYSGYIPYLEEHLQNERKYNLLKKPNICCISKGSEEGEGYDKLLNILKEKYEI